MWKIAISFAFGWFAVSPYRELRIAHNHGLIVLWLAGFFSRLPLPSSSPFLCKVCLLAEPNPGAKSSCQLLVLCPRPSPRQAPRGEAEKGPPPNRNRAHCAPCPCLCGAANVSGFKNSVNLMASHYSGRALKWEPSFYFEGRLKFAGPQH